MVKKRSLFLLLSVLMALTACGQDAGSSGGGSEEEIKIGLSVSDLTLERWQHDRDIFVKQAKKLGAEVLVQSANGDDSKQLSQVENMISQGVDVIVIIPNNSDAMASAASSAKAAGIPILAYDRLINNAEVDAYISFDNERVGEIQAKSIVEEIPEGRYFLLGGSPTDHNAKMFRKGQMNVLQPLVDQGKIKVVGDQWAKGWSASEAMKLTENVLTAEKNQVDAVVASNDSTAGGAIEALKAQGLAGKVAVSGQDADLAACQRIVKGLQTMTVYKPIDKIATKAAEVAVQLARGEKVKGDESIHNGAVEVPSILLDPVRVTKDNMVDTVIKDGFHKYEEVYKGVPEEDRPPRP